MEQNPPKFVPDEPEYHEMLIKGSCDQHGEFHFRNVPAGEYFVIAPSAQGIERIASMELI